MHRAWEMGDASGWAVQAIDAYLDAVDDIHRRWRVIMARALDIKVEGARIGVEASLDIESSFPVVRAFANTRLGDVEGRLASVFQVEIVRADLQGQVRLIEGLADERRAADAALASAVQGVIPPSWSVQRAAMVDAGFDGINEMTSENLAAAMAARTNLWLLDNKLAPEEESALQTYLDHYGNDPMIMSVFFDALGGEGTIKCVDVLGDGVVGVDDGGVGVDAARLRLALALRQSFAVGSSAWNEDEAGGWAVDLLGAAMAREGGVSALGWLCGDSQDAVIGVNLATALADAIDERERVGGHVLIDPSTDPSGVALGQLEAGAVGWEANPWRVNDVAGRVLESLGRYPGAALD